MIAEDSLSKEVEKETDLRKKYKKGILWLLDICSEYSTWSYLKLEFEVTSVLT